MRAVKSCLSYESFLWKIWGRSAAIPNPAWVKRRQKWCVNSGGVNAAPVPLLPFWCQSKSSELTTAPWAGTGSSSGFTEWGGWGKVARTLLSLEYFSLTGTCVLGLTLLCLLTSPVQSQQFSVWRKEIMFMKPLDGFRYLLIGFSQMDYLCPLLERMHL